MSADLTRRAFLVSLLAAPFVAKAELLMPVRALVLEPLMAGDHVAFHRDTWRRHGIYAICEIVKRVEGEFVVTTAPSARPNEELRVPRTAVSLSHGLPANRVNNPSMRHRLVQVPGRIGLIYPEDVSEIRRRGSAHDAEAARRAVYARLGAGR